MSDDCGSGAGCLYKEAMIDTLTERVRVLREAISHYDKALKHAWPEGAMGESFHHWNEARKLLEATQ